ncbi:MAG TPA: DUF3883 domain-containing protein, partial [Ktedonobacterales bacterium]|nr:DUF3883 domain-containing protein [Ktedonobacterales bacterium]
ERAVSAVDSALTATEVQRDLEAERALVESADVRALLDGVRADLEMAEMKRMMPAYVRGFFEAACRRLGMGIAGDINTVFQLTSPHDAVQLALEASYPATLADRLTFRRDLALPFDASHPEAIYLHPGESVFDTVLDLFMARTASEGERGAVFFDAEATEPSIFSLVKAPIVQARGAGAHGADTRHETLAEVLVGVRRYADGRCEEVPAHQLMTLLPGAPEDATQIPDVLLAAADDLTPVESFVYEQRALPRLRDLRDEAEARLPERTRQLTAAFNRREAELAQQYGLLKQAVARNEPASKTKLERCQQELARIEDERAAALAVVQEEPAGIELGTMQLYARAAVLPIAREEAERRRDAEVEQTAVRLAWRYEEAHGGVVEDVSNPQLKNGYDLRSTRPNEPARFIEVKGRARVGEVELTPNEWAQAVNHDDRYWLYVVYDCDSPDPTLRIIQNPAAQEIAHAKGGVIIEAANILLHQPEDLRA